MKLSKLLLLMLFIVINLQSQTVVVNKYYNSGAANGVGDVVELLVIQNNLDMRGMLVKDFSSSMASDGGGKFQFSDNSLWQNLKSGTLIILRNDTTANDINPNDYVLDVGLKNTNYFINKGGSFDIATTEMVMVKSAGSDSAGVTGSIHVLAGGAAGTFFTSAPNPKLRTSGTSGAGKYVFAKNSNSLLADFDGTDADTTSQQLAFGSGNNATNTQFINNLRGGTPAATTVQFGQSNATVERNVGTVYVNVTITNPSSQNATNVDVALTGGTGVNGVDIQNFSTQTLTFPAGSSNFKTFSVVVNNIDVYIDKTFIFTLQNVSGGNNATIGSPSVFTLTILGKTLDTNTVAPINQLRQNDQNGEPVNINKYFTITGVVTLANEINSPSYLQDNTAGIAVFSRGPGLFSASVKIGDSVKVRGRLTHFRGLTQLDSVKSFSVLDSNKKVTPKVVTIPEILNQQWNGFESLEGLLVRVNNVRTTATGTWVGNTNYTIYVGSDSTTIRITTGTTLVGQEIPVNEFSVIGALGQYKTTAPYNDGYQILPRFVSDIEKTTSVNDFSQVPASNVLYNNYPNPFNPTTTISFYLKEAGFVTLKVYNILGKEITTLINQRLNSGSHSVSFNAVNLAGGVYFYELRAGNFHQIKKMMLIK